MTYIDEINEMHVNEIHMNKNYINDSEIIERISNDLENDMMDYHFEIRIEDLIDQRITTTLEE